MSRTRRQTVNDFIRFPATVSEFRNVAVKYVETLIDENYREFISNRDRVKANYNNLITSWDDQRVAGYDRFAN